MGDSVPRALIPELITRWTLAGLPLVVVEGPSDRRFFSLVQRQTFCPESIAELDVRSVDSIEVPAVLLNRHSLVGTGAKQRAVAFGREIERVGHEKGFRSVVDQDLDSFINVKHSSVTVLYIDHSCTEGYLWTQQTLVRMAVQYQCEQALRTDYDVAELYDSIGNCCRLMAAIRLTAIRFPEFDINIHSSDVSVALVGGRVVLDAEQYLQQCRIPGPLREAARTAALAAVHELRGERPTQLMNGHDLLWFLTYALRHITRGPRRRVEEESVAHSLLAFGVLDDRMLSEGLFRQLQAWTSADAAA